MDKISDLALPLFAFYLIVFCNFTKELMGCSMQKMFDTNIYAKHFIGYILLFFLVIMVDPSNMERDLLANFGFSLLTYALFLITTRLSFPIMMLVLILLLVCYILGTIGKKKKQDNKEEEYKNIKLAKNIIFIILCVISVIGFVIYVIEKYREYGSKFSVINFIVGTTSCRNHTPNYAKII